MSRSLSKDDKFMTSRYKYHLFCCQNRRGPGNPKGCCQERGSLSILDFFKKTVYEAGLKDTVRVNECGCLAACRLGPSVVVYPEGIWYTVSSVEAAQEIFSAHIIGGKPVQKFFMKW